jgi:hypothetical protein
MFTIPILEIIRLEEGTYGTFGILKVQKRVTMFTLEPNDQENRTNASSIPAQQYICKARTSPRFGDTFEIENVPGRSNIIFHWGNWEKDTDGCILLGRGLLKNRTGIAKSRVAHRAFMELLRGYITLNLTIKEVY